MWLVDDLVGPFLIAMVLSADLFGPMYHGWVLRSNAVVRQQIRDYFATRQQYIEKSINQIQMSF